MIVSVAATTINTGASTKATAVLRDAAGNVVSGRTVTWSSSDQTIAMVDATTGNVLGMKEGSAEVIGTAEGVSGRALLSVHAVVASVSVSLAAPTLIVGSSTMAGATVRDASGQPLAGHPVSWSSSNAAIARVDASSGLVTTVAEGAAMIRATCEGVMGAAQVQVSSQPVASVTVTLSASSINVGSTTGASAVTRDASNAILTGRAITWSSRNPSVATVNASGIVSGVAQGTAAIVATSEGIEGEAAITVAVVPVASVTVSLASGSLAIGQTTAASAVTRDASNNVLTGRAITWSSSNTAVATVNASGTVTAVAVGTTNIRATSEGITGQAGVTVSLVPVASVAVTLASTSVIIGQTTSASAVTRDAANNVLTGRTITWSSTNTAVATVDASGTVTAVSAGTANIRATSEGVNGQAGLTVSLVPVASVTVTLAATSLNVGQTTTASAVTRDASNNVLTGRAIAWSSSNTAVATVNAAGTVTAVGAGTANIRATSEGIIGQAALTASVVPVASVTVTLGATSLNVGQTTTATAVTRDASNNVLTGRVVTWSSSNTAVATVTASGTVRGIAAGSANIIATSEGVTGQAGVTIVFVPVASVTVTLGSASINVGQTTTASAVTRDALNNVLTGRVVTWSSDNTAVATVNASGTVTAVATGTANIVATSETITGSAALTVTAAPPPPPPGSLVWASDWSTAAGTSANAVFDGGLWNNSVDGGGPANRMEVVSGSGLDFPSNMQNVLKVLYNGANDYWNVSVNNGWSLPPVGGSIYFRMYFRHDVGGSGGGMLHTVQTGPPGNCPYTAEFQFDKVSATEIDFVISNYGGSSSSSNGHDWTVRLSKATTYRVEEQYTRTGTNTWQVHARIYDSNNVLIKDDADFVDVGWTGKTLASFNGTITSGTDCFRNKMIGNPQDGGGRGSSDQAHQHIYYAGFAVSHSGWIGPYVPGEKP